jgi:hypothetical protein
MSANDPMNQSVHSLEIDLSEIDRIAAELDAVADAPAKPKRKRATAKKPITEPSADAPKANVEPVVDEDFKAMIVHGVSQGIDVMRDGLELMEPGDTLRTNVGKCVAKLLERIKPMEAGPLADVVTIVGYLGVWALAGRDWTKKTEEEIRNVTPQ